MSYINKCENCGANLQENNNISFCPYCGSKIYLNRSKEININKNIHKYYTDNTEIVKAKADVIKNRNNLIFGLVLFLLMIAIAAVPLIIVHLEEKKEEERIQNEINNYISKGYVQIKFSSENFESEHYLTVKSQLEAAGFTNIEFIDLNDHGFLGILENDVKSVSIAGDSYFVAGDWFHPDDKVVITFY